MSLRIRRKARDLAESGRPNGGGIRAFGITADWGARWPLTGEYPPINVTRNDTSIVVEALCPGMDREALDVTVVGEAVSIRRDVAAANAAIKLAIVEIAKGAGPKKK